MQQTTRKLKSKHVCMWELRQLPRSNKGCLHVCFFQPKNTSNTRVQTRGGYGAEASPVLRFILCSNISVHYISAQHLSPPPPLTNLCNKKYPVEHPPCVLFTETLPLDCALFRTNNIVYCISHQIFDNNCRLLAASCYLSTSEMLYFHCFEREDDSQESMICSNFPKCHAVTDSRKHHHTDKQTDYLIPLAHVRRR